MNHALEQAVIRTNPSTATPPQPPPLPDCTTRDKCTQSLRSKVFGGPRSHHKLHVFQDRQAVCQPSNDTPPWTPSDPIRLLLPPSHSASSPRAQLRNCDTPSTPHAEFILCVLSLFVVPRRHHGFNNIDRRTRPRAARLHQWHPARVRRRSDGDRIRIHDTRPHRPPLDDRLRQPLVRRHIVPTPALPPGGHE